MEFITGVILGGIIGLLIGTILMALLSADRIREADSLAYARTQSLKKVERKVSEHSIFLNKLTKIYDLLEYQEQVKEPTIITLEKIKKVVKE